MSKQTRKEHLKLMQDDVGVRLHRIDRILSSVRPGRVGHELSKLCKKNGRTVSVYAGGQHEPVVASKLMELGDKIDAVRQLERAIDMDVEQRKQ